MLLLLPLLLLPCCACAATPAPDPTLLLGQSEQYVEYDRAGRLIRGSETVKRSRCVLGRDLCKLGVVYDDRHDGWTPAVP